MSGVTRVIRKYFNEKNLLSFNLYNTYHFYRAVQINEEKKNYCKGFQTFSNHFNF